VAKRTPKYYFRGTTLGYAGDTTSMDTPSTSTTSNPVKAVVFALCYLKPGREGVIYIADAEKTAVLNKGKSAVLKELEEETTFTVTPVEFYKYCEGYITLNEAVNILSEMNIRVYPPFDPTLINLCLKWADGISKKQIERFAELAKKLLQNP
jgi:hypothetical protein